MKTLSHRLLDSYLDQPVTHIVSVQNESHTAHVAVSGFPSFRLGESRVAVTAQLEDATPHVPVVQRPVGLFSSPT